MDENINIQLIIDRAKIAFGKNTQEQLADLFDISPDDFSKRKKRGTLIKLIEKEAYRQHISYDWIKTGEGEMIARQDKKSVINEQETFYSASSSAISNSDSLLDKTAQVLGTDSVFRKALDSNIHAFHEAISIRRELQVTKALLIQCQAQLAEQHNVIENLQAQIKLLNDRLRSAGVG
jgi:hypothetical protein